MKEDIIYWLLCSTFVIAIIVVVFHYVSEKKKHDRTVLFLDNVYQDLNYSDSLSVPYLTSILENMYSCLADKVDNKSIPDYVIYINKIHKCFNSKIAALGHPKQSSLKKLLETFLRENDLNTFDITAKDINELSYIRLRNVYQKNI